MSARILYSLSDNKSAAGGGGGGVQKQHIGCMNGIFHRFDRGHFLSGGRRPVKRLDTGKDGNCDAEEDAMSMKSTGRVLKTAANERHGLSTDSSRSSPSSSCNSSSFSSSFEDNRLVKIELLMETAKDSPRLQRLDVSLPRSEVTTYVDSPSPALRQRKPAASVSSRDFPSLQRPRNLVDSPRFSYDGRESRDVIKSNWVKLREQPRHSLDSKKSSLSSSSSSSSLRTRQQQEEPGRCKWRTSVVAKLMGLEADSNADSRSKPQMGSVDALDKRLQQIEFKRSGKDLRALKQILESMQKFSQIEDGEKNIHRVVTETGNIGRSNQGRSDAIPTRSSSRYARYANRSSDHGTVTDDRRRVMKSERQLQPPRISNQPRELTSPSRTPKSKVSQHLTIGNSRRPIEPRNALSMQSNDDDTSAFRDDDSSEVSSSRVAGDGRMPRKVLLIPREDVDDNSPFKCGIFQAEQPSPVSVLDPTNSEDELLSMIKIASEDFKDGESPRFLRRDWSLQTKAKTISYKKHDHTILQTLPSSGLLVFPTLDLDKPINNLVIDEIMVSDNKDRLCSPAKTCQEHLLQRPCSEISQLRAADVYKQGLDDDNNDCIKAILCRDMHHESPTLKERFDDSGIVLDIERLIFKDLVTEVVTGEVVVLRRNGLANYFRSMAFV